MGNERTSVTEEGGKVGTKEEGEVKAQANCEGRQMN